MGDAGPVSPPLAAGQKVANGAQQRSPPTEVSVLVLGFGPFKSFAINPSFLIASRLPPVLYLKDTEDDDIGVDSGAASSPTIRIYVHPQPVRVSYATAATILRPLLEEYDDPDYIFHIGMAAGRDHYALETRARRDGYAIKDVDEQDGKSAGEIRWKTLGLPEELAVGWDGEDVLKRWRREIRGDPSQSVVAVQKEREKEGKKGELARLSSDAGKFFCEFILYESLGLRMMEEKRSERRVEEARSGSVIRESHELHREYSRRGKVAFLHVPGATDREGIQRGLKIAEGAIRAIVGSWEEGRRSVGYGSS